MAQSAITTKMVVIGGSAGSLEVLLQMVPALPVDANASFIIVVHRKNHADSILPDLLSTRTRMPVKEVEDKEPILANTIYIAPPDYHVLVESRQALSLDSSEKVHHSRPSIDVTFESVAQIFGSSTIGVLLSGANADGAAGLASIKQLGGYSIVQDPATAEVGFMPQQAIKTNAFTKIVEAAEIGTLLKEILNS